MQLLFPVGIQQYLVYESDKYFTILKSKVFTEVHRNMTVEHIQINFQKENMCKL